MFQLSLERPTETELAANKPVLPEIEHLKGKISDKELDSLRAVLSRNADVFSKHKADIGCCNFVDHEIEIEEGSVPHREGARRMTPHKSEACRKEIEMLMENDMIGRRSPRGLVAWSWRKRKVDNSGFVVTSVI